MKLKLNKTYTWKICIFLFLLILGFSLSYFLFFNKVSYYKSVTIEVKGLDHTYPKDMNVVGITPFGREIDLQKEDSTAIFKTKDNTHLKEILISIPDSIGAIMLSLEINYRNENYAYDSLENVYHNNNLRLSLTDYFKPQVKLIPVVLSAFHWKWVQLLIFPILIIIILFIIGYHKIYKSLKQTISKLYQKVVFKYCKAFNKKRLFFLILVLFIFFFFLLVDAFVGVLYKRMIPKNERQRFEFWMTVSKGEKSQFSMKPDLHTTVSNVPGFTKNGTVYHNNLGYKNSKNISVDKPDNTIRILAIGGSTTYGEFVSPSDSWPEILGRIVKDNMLDTTNFGIEVINGGHRGATSVELLNHYINKDRYLHPDIVIIHTGGNDAAAMYYGLPPLYVGLIKILEQRKRYLNNAELFLINNSNIVRLLYTVFSTDLKRNVDEFDFDPDFIVLNSNLSFNNSASFKQNLEILLRNIINDGAIPIFMGYIVLDNNSVNDKIKNNVFENNRITRELANKYSIYYYCMESNSINKEYFIDNVHLNRKGHMIKARYLASKLIPVLDSLRLQ